MDECYGFQDKTIAKQDVNESTGKVTGRSVHLFKKSHVNVKPCSESSEGLAGYRVVRQRLN